MSWERKKRSQMPPELNELGSDTPMYPHVSESTSDTPVERDIFRELRSIKLGAHAAQMRDMTHPIGYTTPHHDDTPPDGLTYSA